MFQNDITRQMESTPIYGANREHPSILIHRIGSREAQQLVRAPRTTAAKVSMTVSVSSDALPSVDAWKNWLTSNMPNDIKDVEIVGHWRSSSRTVLVAVPIQIWHYIKDHPAYNFVSFLLGEVQIFKPTAPPLSFGSGPSPSAPPPRWGKERRTCGQRPRRETWAPPPSSPPPHMLALRQQPSSSNRKQPGPGSSTGRF